MPGAVPGLAVHWGTLTRNTSYSYVHSAAQSVVMLLGCRCWQRIGMVFWKLRAAAAAAAAVRV